VIGFGLGQSSESARRKFLDQVVSSIQEQITDFKNHRVEIEQNPSASKPTPATAAAAGPSSKPVSTIGTSLTVNGFGREKSRSRSVTPLPGERERSEKPPSSSVLKKVPSSTGLAGADNNSKKRSRPANDGPDGPGKIEDEEEEWWERWRKRMRVLDGNGIRRHGKKVTSKKPLSMAGSSNNNNHHRKSRFDKRKFSSSLPNGVPTNGIKMEVNDVNPKRVFIKIEEGDEYERELLFVDEDEPEPAHGINEDLRIMIKVCAWHVQLSPLTYVFRSSTSALAFADWRIISSGIYQTSETLPNNLPSAIVPTLVSPANSKLPLLTVSGSKYRCTKNHSSSLGIPWTERRFKMKTFDLLSYPRSILVFDLLIKSPRTHRNSCSSMKPKWKSRLIEADRGREGSRAVDEQAPSHFQIGIP
jgi:hypothetical protein